MNLFKNKNFFISMVITAVFIMSLLTGCTSSTNNDNSGSSTTTTDITAQGWIGSGNSGWQTSGTASSGTGLSYFYNPHSVCVDSSDNIYVVNTNNNRIEKWNSSGVFQGWIGGGKSGWQTSGTASSGTGLEYFSNPNGICIDSSGDIYVAEYSNNRISKWNSSGEAQGWIGGGNSGWQTSGTASSGTGLAYFFCPIDVYVNNSRDIFVADGSNNRICKWNSTGEVQGWIGGGNSGWQTSGTASSGDGLAYFYSPWGVYIDSNGDIYVADTNNHRIDKWNSSGEAQGWIGGGNSGWQTSGTASGSGLAYFSAPWGVYIDSSGDIYIADFGFDRIDKWSKSGVFQGWIGGGNSGWQTSGTASSGTGLSYFYEPIGVCLDSSGNIYVADNSNNRICKWK